ncbi:hypothetical protein CSA80_01800 [Candidatus Saccharibacteria bacterium]|nr:MAG: hypothetical protein CSA80_01800 [Candidatus Saccharibacteria bacterium]
MFLHTFSGAYESLGDTSAPLDAPEFFTRQRRNEPQAGCGLPPNEALFDRPKTYAFDPLEHIFNAGSYDSETVAARRELIAELLSLTNQPEAAQAFAGSFALGELHDWLTKPTKDPDLSSKGQPIYTPRIEQYRRNAKKQTDNAYEPDDHAVWKLPEVHRHSEEAAQAFTMTYGEKFPRLAKAVAQQTETFSRVSPEDIDVNTYIRSAGSDTAQSCLDEARSAYHETTNAGALAHTVAGLTPQAVETTEDAFCLDGLVQPLFEHSKQDPHSIEFGTDRTVVVTGENGGGKTFFLEAVSAAIRNSHSTGHAAVSSGAMPPVHLLRFFERPASGGSELSAFGKEIVMLSRFAEKVERLRTQNPDAIAVYLGDEPFSGTDPNEKQQLLHVFLRGLQKLGVAAIIAAHDDVSGLVASGVADPYKVGIDENNVHTLEKGIGESDAFTAARRQGLEEAIIERAEALKNGSDVDLSHCETQPLTPTSPPEHYKRNGSAGLSWFFNVPPARPRPQGEEHLHNFTAEDASKKAPRYDVNKIIGNDTIFGTQNPQSVLHKLVLQGGTTSETILAARQEFFERAGNYQALDTLLAELADFRHLVFALSESRRVRSEPSPFDAANPLANLQKVLPALLADIDFTQARDYYYSSEAADAHDKYADALFDFAAAIIEQHGSDIEKRFIAQYRQVLEKVNESYKLGRHQENTQNPNADTSWQRAKRPLDKILRADLYELCETILAVRRSYQPDEHQLTPEDSLGAFAAAGQPDEYQLTPEEAHETIKQKLDDIFYPLKFLGLDDDTRDTQDFQQRRVERTSLSYNAYRELHRLLTSNLEVPLETLQQIIVAKNLTTDTILPYAENFDKLYRGAQAGEAARLRLTSSEALAILRFAATNAEPIDNIIRHLKNIGGTIAEDLARYFDDNVRSFFDGKSTGETYRQYVTETMQAAKPGTYLDVRLRIGDVLPSPYEKVFPRSPLSDASDLSGILVAAQYMKTQAYSPWRTAKDQTTFEHVYPVGHPEYTPTNISYGSGGVTVISGANMSGKTTLLRALFAQHALGQGPGLTPGKAAGPLSAHSIFVDRPKHDTAQGLSSFGMDVDYWKQIIETLRDAPPSVVFVDEPFSTTQARDQEALILSMTEWLTSRGHRLVMATHHHGAIERLQQAQKDPRTVVNIAFYHLTTSQAESGEIEFTHELHEGVALSQAFDVVHKLGNQALKELLASGQ